MWQCAVLRFLVALLAFTLMPGPSVSAGDPSAGGVECERGGPPGENSRKKRSPKGSEKKPAGGKGSRTKQRKKAGMADVPPDERAEDAALEALGDGFALARTRHYSILYDTKAEDARAFGVSIEQTYRSCMNYSLRLGVDARAPKRKLLICYFDQHADYSVHSERIGKGKRPESEPGVYYPDLNLSMFYDFRNEAGLKRARERAEGRIKELRKQMRGTRLSPERRKDIRRQIVEARRQANRSNVVGGDVSESIVQHEVAHQVMWNVGFHNPGSFVANPRWFAEGTAMMFEPISDGNSANFGAVNKPRLRDFRALAASGRLAAVRDFISHRSHFAPQTMTAAYAQSWALVHYLNRAKRKAVKKYVASLNRRPAHYVPSPAEEIATFEAAFGRLDAKWDRKWRQWMRKVR